MNTVIKNGYVHLFIKGKKLINNGSMVKHEFTLNTGSKAKAASKNLLPKKENQIIGDFIRNKLLANTAKKGLEL